MLQHVAVLAPLKTLVTGSAGWAAALSAHALVVAARRARVRHKAGDEIENTRRERLLVLTYCATCAFTARSAADAVTASRQTTATR